VTINGGTVYAERILIDSCILAINGGNVTSALLGGRAVTVNGGSVNVTRGNGYLSGLGAIANSAGEPVYLNTLTVGYGASLQANASVAAAEIDGIAAAQAADAASGVYGIKDVRADAAGNVYFWLPATPKDAAGIPESRPVSVRTAGHDAPFANTYQRTADNFNAETLYDAPMPPIEGEATAVAPEGGPAIGKALTASAAIGNAGYEPGAGPLHYTWYRGTDETGYFAVSAASTSPEYTPQLADANFRLKVRVTAAGFSGALWSEATDAIIPLPADQNPGYRQSPSILATYGQTLAQATITPGGWALKPGASASSLVGDVGAGAAVTLQYAATGYDTVEKDAVVAVSPKTVSVRGAKAINRVYDGTDSVAMSAAGASLDGLLADDAGKVGLSVAAEGKLSDKSAGVNRVAAADMRLTGERSANYEIGAAAVRVTIQPRAAAPSGTVTASKRYDGSRAFDGSAMDTSGIAFDGMVAGDDLALSAESASGTLASANVGSGSLVLGGAFALAGNDFRNYALAGLPQVYGTIEPSTPEAFAQIAPALPSAAPISYGQALGESALTGGDPRGAFAWEDAAARPAAGSGDQPALFAPDAQTRANYGLPEGYALPVGVPLAVGKASPAIVVSASFGSGPPPVIALTARLTGVSGVAPPEGTVEFRYSLGGGDETLAVAGIAGGAASAELVTPAAGTYAFAAVYAGDGNYSGAQDTLSGYTTELVAQEALAVTGATTVTFGDAGGRLDTSGGSGGGAVVFSAPANDFFDIGADGAITTKKAGGPIAVTARKASDGTYLEATATAGVTVAPRPIGGATVRVSQEYPYTGAPVTPQAQDVTVELGGQALAHGTDYTLAVTSGGTAIGAGTITATGRGNYAGAASGAFSVAKAAPSVTLAISPASGAQYGQTATLRAQVRNMLSNDVPAGTVTFKRNGAAIGEAKALSGGDADMAFELGAAGLSTFTAEYSGSASYAAAASEGAAYSVAKAARELTIIGATVEYGSEAALQALPNLGDDDGDIVFSADANSYLSVTPDGVARGLNAGGPATVRARIADGSRYADAEASIQITVQKRETKFFAAQLGGADGKLQTSGLIVEFGEAVDEFGAGNLALTGAKAAGAAERQVAAPAGYERRFGSGSIYVVPLALDAGTPNGGTVSAGVAGLSNHEIAGAAPVGVTVYRPVKLVVNSVGINYSEETLTGLVPGASYAITPSGGLSAVVAGPLGAGETAIQIASGWLGRTLGIVRLGEAKTVDSDPYELAVSPRPAAPSDIEVSSRTSGGATVGSLSGLAPSKRYEYYMSYAGGGATAPADAPAQAASLEVALPDGAGWARVFLREKDTPSSFDGEAVSRAILPPGDVDLGDALEGDAPAPGAAVEAEGARIASIAALGAGSPFALSYDGAGGADGTGVWTVAAKPGLPAGEYEETLEASATADADGSPLTLRPRAPHRAPAREDIGRQGDRRGRRRDGGRED
jgi:hypothetical protein